ncbi:hypothetical protein QCA50_011526 [Cerrena zonata]|uniref:Uncharacterized protein n=1 Tax=Cerrena zonata TaxID=2478898 RepID=A0AAW0FU69_9APHY
MSSLVDNATSVVPNPYTPFAFLPPEASTQYLAGGIIEEARIYKNTKFSIPDVLYYLSRITSGGLYVSYSLFADHRLVWCICDTSNIVTVPPSNVKAMTSSHAVLIWPPLLGSLQLSSRLSLDWFLSCKMSWLVEFFGYSEPSYDETNVEDIFRLG